MDDAAKEIWVKFNYQTGLRLQLDDRELPNDKIEQQRKSITQLILKKLPYSIKSEVFSGHGFRRIWYQQFVGSSKSAFRFIANESKGKQVVWEERLIDMLPFLYQLSFITESDTFKAEKYIKKEQFVLEMNGGKQLSSQVFKTANHLWHLHGKNWVVALSENDSMADMENEFKDLTHLVGDDTNAFASHSVRSVYLPNWEAIELLVQQLPDHPTVFADAIAKNAFIASKYDEIKRTGVSYGFFFELFKWFGEEAVTIGYLAFDKYMESRDTKLAWREALSDYLSLNADSRKFDEWLLNEHLYPKIEKS